MSDVPQETFDAEAQKGSIKGTIHNLTIALCGLEEQSGSSDDARRHVARYLDDLADDLRHPPKARG